MLFRLVVSREQACGHGGRELLGRTIMLAVDFFFLHFCKIESLNSAQLEMSEVKHENWTPTEETRTKPEFFTCASSLPRTCAFLLFLFFQLLMSGNGLSPLN